MDPRNPPAAATREDTTLCALSLQSISADDDAATPVRLSDVFRHLGSITPHCNGAARRARRPTSVTAPRKRDAPPATSEVDASIVARTTHTRVTYVRTDDPSVLDTEWIRQRLLVLAPTLAELGPGSVAYARLLAQRDRLAAELAARDAHTSQP